jgi:BMFP domain-containing protein YqiC
MPGENAVGVTNNPQGSQVLVREIATDIAGVATTVEMQVIELAGHHGQKISLAERQEQEVQSVIALDTRRSALGRGRLETSDRRGNVGHRGVTR